MPIARSRTFRSGKGQAVRLPREVAFEDDTELVIVRSGEVMTIYPAKRSLARLIERLRDLPGPGEVEAREIEEIPERPRL